MKKLLTAVLFAGLILPALLTGSALAQGDCDDKSIVGGSFTLESGETFECDIAVFGGSLTVEEGATVTENVAVFGGDADIAGNVEGDIVVFGGTVDLASSAVVDGRLVTVGGSVDRDEGAVVSGGEGDINYDFDFGDFPTVPVPGIREIDMPWWFGRFDPVFATLWRGMEIIGGALALGLIALLVAAVWPEPTRRVSTTLTAAPAVAGGLGLLTLIAVPVLLVLMTITIILIPVSLLGVLLYVMAIVFGWLALGAVVGERLVLAFNRPNVSLAVATALGTLLVSLVMGIVGQIPCLGFVVQVVFAAIGVGAVVLTRFGMQPYLGGPASPASPAAPTPPPASAIETGPTPEAPPVSS